MLATILIVSLFIRVPVYHHVRVLCVFTHILSRYVYGVFCV